MTIRQLQIRSINPDGSLSAPSKYPVGCTHSFASDTRVLIYHPDDRNPEWCEELNGEVPKYTLAYATHSCLRGLVVEYVDAEPSTTKV